MTSDGNSFSVPFQDVLIASADTIASGEVVRPPGFEPEFFPTKATMRDKESGRILGGPGGVRNNSVAEKGWTHEL
jgi:hypothetical protein